MYRFILFILLSFVISSELPQGLTEWEKNNMHIIDLSGTQGLLLKH